MGSIYDSITELSPGAFAIVTFFSVLACVLLAKLVGRLPNPLYEIELAHYGIAIGLSLVLVGMFDANSRGLVLAVGGAVIAAVSAVVLLGQLSGFWAAVLYGLPLAIPGGAGVALLAYGVLHAKAALATLGADLVIAGFFVSGITFLVIRAVLLIREQVHGAPGAPVVIALAALSCIVIALGTVVAEALKRKREKSRS